MKQEVNQLFPVFLKLDQLNVLIVGGGKVALEKLTFMLKSSPNAQITLVAPDINPEIVRLSRQYENLVLKKRPIRKFELGGNHIVIAATNNAGLNDELKYWCRLKGILLNVADKPDLCDFYMGGIVTKGNLKIAISTNGKSPTMAKRIRQLLEDILPDEVDELLLNMHRLRSKLTLRFTQKVKYLNRITAPLANVRSDD